MSYIPPNGNIWLLHNVPIDKTYQNTLYWPISQSTDSAVGRAAQRDYFIGVNSPFVKYRLTNQYYTRHERGSIRVAVLADNILDCNYLVFQNASFGAEKYFFCFITSVEYVNHTTAQVNFEIDVIQTWYFDYKLEPCFLERTHTRTDNRYENIVPEPVEVGEYVYSYIYHEPQTQPLYVIMAIVTVDNDGKSEGKRYGRIYGGCTLYAFYPNDIVGINAKISQYITNPEAIVSIYMVPRCLITADVEPTGVELTDSDVVTGLTDLRLLMPEPAVFRNFDGYTPHNNKLYSYPYTMLDVFTPDGGNLTLRYEFFNTENHAPQFNIGGSVTQPVGLTIVPKNYKMTGEYPSSADGRPFNESLSIQDYPICSWNTDAYKAWVAQNSVPIAIGLGATVGSGLLNAGISAISMNPMGVGSSLLGMTQSLISQGAGIMQQDYRASIAADQLHGHSKGSSNVSMDIQGFFFGHKILNGDSARRIDSFFDRFGYAIKKIQEPFRKNRRYYTYIKTLGCTIHGSIPADDEDIICKLHDTGITYWDPSETSDIGNFNLAGDNTPLG